MPVIGSRRYELRVRHFQKNWRIVYRADPDAGLIVAVFAKATEETLEHLIDEYRDHLAAYDQLKAPEVEEMIRMEERKRKTLEAAGHRPKDAAP